MPSINRTTTLTLFTILSMTGKFGLRVQGFSTGAPANSCKDPSTFHTKKINSTHEGIIMPQDMKTNPYRLVTDSTAYSPGQEITVTLETTSPNILLEGFFLQAVRANIDIRDLRREPFGVFKNTTSREQPSLCQSKNNVQAGGITHTDKGPKERITVTWLAPSEFDPGSIQFLATGVKDYDIYWTDIRSPVLTSMGYEQVKETQQSGFYSPTALWYTWMKYLQQRLVNDNQNSTVQETV